LVDSEILFFRVFFDLFDIVAAISTFVVKEMMTETERGRGRERGREREREREEGQKRRERETKR
jgi:hypothetical protein